MKTSMLILHFHDSNKLGSGLFFAIAALLLLIYLTINSVGISVEQVHNLTAWYDSKFVTYVISFLIMLLCALTPIPAEIIALTNTIIYTPMEAFLVTWSSALVSASIGYELGRLNSIDPCKYKSSSKICRWLNTYGYKALAIMRLIPIVPFFALNICSGILKLDRCKYTIITAVTIVPAALLLTYFPHLFM